MLFPRTGPLIHNQSGRLPGRAGPGPGDRRTSACPGRGRSWQRTATGGPFTKRLDRRQREGSTRCRPPGRSEPDLSDDHLRPKDISPDAGFRSEL